MFYTIYKVTNILNNKIYIGCHKTTDLDDNYMGSGKILKRAQEKYGIENFQKEILEVFESSEEMFEMESRLVNEEFVKSNDTYNLKEGGCGGFDYINSNISYENRGFDFINKNGLNNAANQCYILFEKLKDSDEFRKWFKSQVSKGLKEYYKFNEGHFTGKTHNVETKKKMSDAKKGKYSGNGNPSFGTMWIHNLEEKLSKKIKKDEFSEWETKGWLKGRKMKFL